MSAPVRGKEKRKPRFRIDRIIGERFSCALSQWAWNSLADRIEKAIMRVNRRAYLDGYSAGLKDGKLGRSK